MIDVDQFSRTLLEEAKRFFEKASEYREKAEPEGETACLHSALVLGFSALEAHINSIAADFAQRRELSVFDRSVFSERDVELRDGEFRLTDKNKNRYYRLEDRIQFLYRRFSRSPIDKSTSWWCGLKAGILLRNSLVHPKEVAEIRDVDVRQALEAIIETLNVLYRAIYKSPYPLMGRGLQSRMRF